MKKLPLKILIVLTIFSIVLIVSCAGMDVEGVPLSSKSKKLIKGKNQQYGLWVHKNKWRKQNFVIHPIADIQLVYRSMPSDVSIMTIFMNTEYGLDHAKASMINAFRKTMPDLIIESEKKKWVDSNEVLYLKMRGTKKSIPVTIAVYFCPEKMGMMYICGFAPNNLFKKHEFDILDAMDGFVVLDSLNGNELLESSFPTPIISEEIIADKH